ncbi:hypothetical protein CVT25_003062 [Psilocybe cyanescens]|uniref:Uncharacterized protein n=1 Tax=Psilocybe cyanescens TaxID=93625 RepID=A0A409X4Q4_PSICY|nr:hypothetical protein CVT25_003062 [Psilocybe cyanescens]
MFPLNVDESATKWMKTAAGEEGAEADEGEGKGARGKAPSKIHKTSTQQYQEDAAEATTHFKPVSRKLDRAATSVAPPEHPPSSPSPSHCVNP